MKALIAVLTFWVWFHGSSLAASIQYEFFIADVPIPGQPGVAAFPEDLNDRGDILAHARINGIQHALIHPTSGNRKPALFACPGADDTIATAIANPGQITGRCSIRFPGGLRKGFGFVRNPDGSFGFLDFPGADGTMSQGITGAAQWSGGLITR